MIVWVLFLTMITAFLAIDLGVFNRDSHEISYKEATRWTIIWVTIALLFSIGIYFIYQNHWVTAHYDTTSPLDALTDYLTGYLIELSLSVDNIFVIAVIFKSFKIPKLYQHRVLFWGILGAIVFRGLMIFFGVALIENFKWTTYVFGIFLIYTAFKSILGNQDEEFDPKESWVYRMVRKFLPVTGKVYNDQFFIKRAGITIATPLFLALIVVEFTDILFALDSIPAILAITRDPFIIFTSNIFAILGLRSMYFFIANMLDSFHYLKYSLFVILVYVGIKLILVNHFHMPTYISLAVISVSLFLGVIISLKKR